MSLTAWVMTDRYRATSSLSATSRLCNDFRQTLRVTQPLMESLTEWYRALPQSSDSDESAVNASGFLHLGFHAVKTLLFRAIMRPFHNAEYLQLSADDRVEHEQARSQLRIGAKSCAIAFSTYIRNLDSSHTQAFWPFCEFQANATRAKDAAGCPHANSNRVCLSLRAAAFAVAESVYKLNNRAGGLRDQGGIAAGEKSVALAVEIRATPACTIAQR